MLDSCPNINDNSEGKTNPKYYCFLLKKKKQVSKSIYYLLKMFSQHKKTKKRSWHVICNKKTQTAVTVLFIVQKYVFSSSGMWTTSCLKLELIFWWFLNIDLSYILKIKYELLNHKQRVMGY